MKIYPVNHLPDVIILGRQTEYGVNEIRIDCAPWLAVWPGMQISVWVTPPNGDGAYPASIRVEGDLVVWEIGAADTNTAGSGYVEIMGLAEGKKKLSATAATKVLGTTTGTTTEPPEAHRAWVEEVARNAMRAENAAKKAEESAAEIGAALDEKLDRSGYSPNMYLGTDENGNVVEKTATAGGGENTGDYVKFTEQKLTSEQKTQARANIGAADAETVDESIAKALADAKESGEFDGDDGVGIKSVSVTRSPDQYGYYYIIINLTDGQQQAIPYKNGSDANVTAENIANALGFTPVSVETVNNIAEGKIDSPATGMVGQILAVKTVDDNGKPTEWETVTFTVPRPDEKPTEVVLYTAQELTEEQKAQARTNIGAAAADDLANYYLKSETYSREEINQRISAIPKFRISVVSSLPTSNISETTIYLVGGGETGNLYTEYIRVNDAWEVLGSQRVDLTGYATETWVVGQLAGYQPKGNYALKSELPDVPVKSVNNKTGDVKLNASDVGADPSGTAKNAVSTHNQSETAHQDIRQAVSQLSAEMAGKVTSPSVAEVGQVIAVKAVDENGKPTEWEAVPGGVTSWNDLPDKPVVSAGSDTLTWDGNTDGLVSFEGMFYKVSDAIVTIEDFADTYSIGLDGDEGEGEFGIETIVDTGMGVLFGIDGIFALVSESGVGADMGGAAFQESGVYFVTYGEAGFITKLTIPGYTGFGQEKIAPSHLYQPDWNQNDESAADFIKNRLFDGRKPTWDDIGMSEVCIFEGVALEVPSDGLPIEPNDAPGIGDVVNVIFDGSAYSCVASNFFDMPLVGDATLVTGEGESTGEPFAMLFVEKTVASLVVKDTTKPHDISVSANLKVAIPDVYYSSFAKVFYYGQGDDEGYLTSGIFASERITRDELLLTAKNGKPIIVSKGDTCWYSPLAIMPYEGDDSNNYGRVDIMVDGAILHLYTAEYVPPTT